VSDIRRFETAVAAVEVNAAGDQMQSWRVRCIGESKGRTALQNAAGHMFLAIRSRLCRFDTSRAGFLVQGVGSLDGGK
jgi:hypothetical protein